MVVLGPNEEKHAKGTTSPQASRSVVWSVQRASQIGGLFSSVGAASLVFAAAQFCPAPYSTPHSKSQPGDKQARALPISLLDSGPFWLGYARRISTATKSGRHTGSFTTKPKAKSPFVQAALQRRGGAAGPSRPREMPRRLAPLPPVPPAWPSADPPRPPLMGSFYLSPANRPFFSGACRQPTGRRQRGQKGPNSKKKCNLPRF